jgi:hypothetical protein
MKKNQIIILVLAILLVAPLSAQASIFDDLYGAVRGLQKQVVGLVSTKIDIAKPASLNGIVVSETWKTFASSTLGYEVQYPKEFGTTSIFSIMPGYVDADAFVRVSREDFLKKILKPGSSTVDLAVQDAAIFFRSAEFDDMYVNPEKYVGKISTSTKQIGSTTVEYILHSEKTDSSKFGGGSTEKVIFTNGSTTVEAEANYSTEIPAGPTKAVFDKMLTTFRFTEATSSPMIGTTTTAILVGTSTEAIVASSTVGINQTAGTLLSN